MTDDPDQITPIEPVEEVPPADPSAPGWTPPPGNTVIVEPPGTPVDEAEGDGA